MGYETALLLPLLVASGVFGASVGSFMDVIRDRGVWSFSLSDRSRCAACKKILTRKELVPVVSFVILRGKCGSCGSRIPAYHLYAEVLTGVLFVCSFLFLDSAVGILAGMLAASFLVPIILADIERMEVPEHLSVPFACIAFIAAAALAIHTESIAPIVSGFALAAPFYLIWLCSSGRAMGLGDAKVALPLGFLLPAMYAAAPLLTVLHAAVSVAVFSFWFGTLGVAGYALYTRIRTGSFGISRRMHTPLVPGIAVAFFFVFFTGMLFSELLVWV